MARTDIPLVVKAHTGSSYTMGVGDWGAIHTNRGGGALTYTFPAPSSVPAGTWATVFSVAAGDLVITTSAGDQLVALNDAAATSLTFGENSNEIGNGCTVVSDGTSWLTIVHLAAEGAGTTVA